MTATPAGPVAVLVVSRQLLDDGSPRAEPFWTRQSSSGCAGGQGPGRPGVTMLGRPVSGAAQGLGRKGFPELDDNTLCVLGRGPSSLSTNLLVGPADFPLAAGESGDGERGAGTRKSCLPALAVGLSSAGHATVQVVILGLGCSPAAWEGASRERRSVQ